MDVDEAIEKCRWTLTDYVQQHEYIRHDDNPKAFQIIREAIKKDAVVGEFLGRRYRYWLHGDYKYWMMGVIINRARVKPALAG